MSDRLDSNIRRYYEDHSLDPAALARLKETLGDAAEPPTPQRRAPRAIIAAAAAVLLVAVAAAILLNLSNSAADQTLLELARQAAVLHNQKLDVEFEADAYQGIRRNMRQLGFEPVAPVRLGNMNLRILGARYGSIQGQPAVQIKLIDPDGEICTLYQLRPVGELARMSDESRQIDGVIVEVWQEKGLLMVLARPAA